MSRNLSDYSYDYPQSLIALEPAPDRAGSRLLVLNRANQTVTHESFADIADHFGENDVLVLNNSKVIPCRLLTRRSTGGKQEIFLIKKISEVEPGRQVWEILLGPNQAVKKNDAFAFPGLTITILNEATESPRLASLTCSKNLFEILPTIGHIPLPSYIKRGDTPYDTERYQTVYAKTQGSVAAPTAGLHFTPELLQNLTAKGVTIHTVTLHVGLGTFLPVRTSNIQDHKMHSEEFSIEPEVWQSLQTAKQKGKRITAVGTTSVRVLETLAAHPGTTQNQTDIFIHPPFRFKMVDRLITNFHQPESTLLMLVSAFAGREFILSSYAEAIKRKYRLFSYGDAMLIL